MDPNQPRRIKIKTTAAHTEKGKRTAGNGSQPPKRPRSTPLGAPSVL